MQVQYASHVQCCNRRRVLYVFGSRLCCMQYVYAGRAGAVQGAHSIDAQLSHGGTWMLQGLHVGGAGASDYQPQMHCPTTWGMHTAAAALLCRQHLIDQLHAGHSNQQPCLHAHSCCPLAVLLGAEVSFDCLDSLHCASLVLVVTCLFMHMSWPHVHPVCGSHCSSTCCSTASVC